MTTTKRYKLPDALGGGIVEGEKKWPHGGGIDHELSITVPGLARTITLFESDVTEVPPPIPTEPEPGAYQIGEHVCVRFVAPDGESDWAYPVLNSGRQQDWAHSDFDDSTPPVCAHCDAVEDAAAQRRSDQ